jgi:hypothetical protein
MKALWCWRCKQEVPMLDENEYAAVLGLYRQCFEQAGTAGLSAEGSGSGIERAFAPVTGLYEELTGWHGMHHNAVMHHRL